MKKYFLFSDVHGEFTALFSSLEKAGFDPENKEHILISLGDNFDRGTQNKEVLEFLFEYDAKDRLQMIMGNHDEFFIDFLTGRDDGLFNCQNNGMAETLDDLSGLSTEKFIARHEHLIIAKIRENYPDLIKLFKKAVNIIEIGDYILTHAGYAQTKRYYIADEDVPWEVDNWARTDYFIEQFPHTKFWQGDKTYIFGHWHAYKLRDQVEGTKYNQDGIRIRNHHTFKTKNFVGIDACTNLSGFVNIFIIDEEK